MAASKAFPAQTLALYLLLTLLVLSLDVTFILFSAIDDAAALSSWNNVLSLILCGMVIVNIVLLALAQATADSPPATAAAADRWRHRLLVVLPGEINDNDVESNSAAAEESSRSSSDTDVRMPLQITTGPLVTIMLASTTLLLAISVLLQVITASDAIVRTVSIFMLVAVTMSAGFAILVR